MRHFALRPASALCAGLLLAATLVPSPPARADGFADAILVAVNIMALDAGLVVGGVTTLTISSIDIGRGYRPAVATEVATWSMGALNVIAGLLLLGLVANAGEPDAGWYAFTGTQIAIGAANLVVAGVGIDMPYRDADDELAISVSPLFTPDGQGGGLGLVLSGW